MILDDSESARTLLRDQLREFDFEVVVFEDGDDLLDTLEDDEGFDIVILDVNLPGQAKDGLEVCNEMRRKGYSHPVLFVTGDSKESTVKDVKKLGQGHDIIGKQNLSAEILYNYCDALIQQSRMYTKLSSVESDTKEIKAMVRSIRPEALIKTIKEEVCETSHAKMVTKKEMTEAVGLSSTISRLSKNIFAWLAFVLIVAIGGVLFEWLRYTYNLANSNREGLSVIKASVQQIPTQMQAQQVKMDKILDRINKRVPSP